MECVIVTGMSGAGKSTALKFFEDMGFLCVDNLPPSLILKFLEVARPNSDISKLAIGVDIRGGKLFDDLLPALETIDMEYCKLKILFLESSDEILMKRFKETRRLHPLSKTDGLADGLIEGIRKEREMLRRVKARANYIVNSSQLLTRELREKLAAIFDEERNFNNLMITIISFGFKYGIPADSDLVFDVRFLPNPFYVDELKHMTGNDAPVRDFVMNHAESGGFLHKTLDLLTFLIPHYISEGKNQLVVAIGCTGGRHRSVALANELSLALSTAGQSVLVKHRDSAK